VPTAQTVRILQSNPDQLGGKVLTRGLPWTVLSPSAVQAIPHISGAEDTSHLSIF
jgi:hypothetical protein